MYLEGGKYGGVVTGHDVIGAAVRNVDDAHVRIGPPQDPVTVGRHVDTNLSTTTKTKQNICIYM